MVIPMLSAMMSSNCVSNLISTNSLLLVLLLMSAYIVSIGYRLLLSMGMPVLSAMMRIKCVCNLVSTNSLLLVLLLMSAYIISIGYRLLMCMISMAMV
jgi:hypothetical protein